MQKITLLLVCTALVSCSSVQKIVPTFGNGQLDVPSINVQQRLILGQVALRYALGSKAKALRLIELASQARADLDELDDDYTVISAAEVIKNYVVVRESLSVADKQLLIGLADLYASDERVALEIGDAKLKLKQLIDLIESNAELAVRSQSGQLN